MATLGIRAEFGIFYPIDGGAWQRFREWNRLSTFSAISSPAGVAVQRRLAAGQRE